MTHAVDNGLTKAFPASPWLFEPAGPSAVILLSAALGAAWIVQREIGCEGAILIIALAATEVEGVPSLMLYEKDGQTRVTTVVNDEWSCDQASSAHSSRWRELRRSTDERSNQPLLVLAGRRRAKGCRGKV